MATDKYTKFIEDAQASGEIPEEWIDRIKDTYEASGLRNDYRTERERATALEAQLATLRNGLLVDRFKAMGIPGSPTAYSLPADLDPTDPEKLETWAVDMGLVQRQSTTTPELRSTHDRIAAASNEGSEPAAPPITGNESEEEFWAKAQAREALLKRT